MTIAELVACGVLLRDIHHYYRAGKIAFNPPLPGRRPTPKYTRPKPYAERGYSRPSGQVTRRPCMCCGEPFKSEGPHHRMCGSCRSRTVSPYEPD